MSVSLSKGGNVSLSKEEPGLARILAGLGWDARSTDGAEFDLDASAFLLTAGDRVRSDADFIFYNNLKSSDGAVVHAGDNRTGLGDGDDEELRVDLTAVGPDIQKIVIAVTIHDADTRRQVSNAYIRIVNDGNGREITRYDLGEDASAETAIVFGELYRHGAEWKFRAVGQGYKGGLGPLARNYGVNVG